MRAEVQITLSDFVTAALQAGEQENWLAALALALTLPDICAAVDDPGPHKSRARYAKWWDQYVAPQYLATPGPKDDWVVHSYLPGQDAFYLRCSYLHAGTDVMDGKNQLMNRVRFLGPSNVRRFGLDEETRTLTIPINMFVESVCSGVGAWVADHANDSQAQERLAGLISVLPSAITLVRPDGSRQKWT